MVDKYIERKKQLCGLLKEMGADFAIVGEPESVCYLTGISIIPYERYYGLTINVIQETYTMIVPALDVGCMKGNVEEIIYQDAEGPKSAIISSLEGCRKLVVETGYFSMRIGDIFDEAAERVEDIGDCIARLRMKKNSEEIVRMQRAAEIVDETLLYIKDFVKPGMTEKEINMEMFAYMAKKPGFITDEKIILVQGGANSANPHGVSGDYRIKKGDILLIDFCAYYDNYWSDITRCMFLGEKIHPKLKEIYEIVKRANLAAISRVRPGVKAYEIDNAARTVITEAGYGEYFLHRTGHGLGLSVHEEPFMTMRNELVLEEGMTFTIEPGIYLEGIGGVRIEDDILVTADGCKVLTHSSKNMEDYIIEV